MKELNVVAAAERLECENNVRERRPIRQPAEDMLNRVGVGCSDGRVEKVASSARAIRDGMHIAAAHNERTPQVDLNDVRILTGADRSEVRLGLL